MKFFRSWFKAWRRRVAQRKELEKIRKIDELHKRICERGNNGLE